MAPRLLRVALTWLMLLALPLQGLAASGGWPCHAAFQRLPAALAAAGADAHAGHPHAGAAAGAHAHDMAPPAADPDVSSVPAATGAGMGASGLHAGAGCAACANCGHAIGLPPAWPSVGTAPPPAPPLAWVLPSWPLPHWPVADKPPRS